MPISDALAEALLDLYFNATAIPNVADDASVSPITTIYMSLHTGDPDGGNQETSEADYGGYDRVAVSRASGGWTISGTDVNPTSDIEFPTCTSGSNTITHVGFGRSASGTGTLDWSGSITSMAVATDDQPVLDTDSTVSLT